MGITGYWTALGLAFAATALARLITRDATAPVRKDLGKASLESAYVHVLPRIGGGFDKGRTMHWSLQLPLVALAGCALAFTGALAMTIFPKYWSADADVNLYHALGAPFYVGLAVTYVSCLVMLFQYFAASVRGRASGNL